MSRNRIPSVFLLLLVLLQPLTAARCAALLPAAENRDCPAIAPPVYRYEVVRTYPHDPQAFTQGLVYHQGLLYESTGKYGRSSLREVRPETGEVVRHRRLRPRFFGEGITLYHGRIIQLTWKSQMGFVWNREDFNRLRSFRYRGEGWGITHDGARLIVSDGTSTLAFWDPQTFREIGRLHVREGDRPVTFLNELEYINGEIYANIWQSDRIARIDPDTGCVTGWIDLTGLLGPRMMPEEAVLNGIAYDDAADRLFVTGKYWPRLFQIRLVAPKGR
jgi:glutamine cyclotransferase